MGYMGFIGFTFGFIFSRFGVNGVYGGFLKFGVHFGDPQNKENSLLGSILGFPCFGKLPHRVYMVHGVGLLQGSLSTRQCVVSHEPCLLEDSGLLAPNTPENISCESRYSAESQGQHTEMGLLVGRNPEVGGALQQQLLIVQRQLD